MRQPQRNNNNNRSRGRGRNNNNNKSSNPLTRGYESNGPDVKIRGNAATIAEKYSDLARDAQSSSDTVMAENYFQHAEHYNRLVAAATLQQEEKRAADEARRAEQNEKRAERQNQNDDAKADNGQPVEGEVSAVDVSAETEEQPRRNGRGRQQRNRRPRKEANEGDNAAETAEASEGMTKDAAALPEGLLSTPSSTEAAE